MGTQGDGSMPGLLVMRAKVMTEALGSHSCSMKQHCSG